MMIKKMNIEEASLTSNGYGVGGTIVEREAIEAYKQAVSDAYNHQERTGKPSKSIQRMARRAAGTPSFRKSLFKRKGA